MITQHLAPSPSLAGTFPLRPFTDHFVGTITADGSSARVAAIACDGTGAITLLSLVGSDTTCGAAFALLSKSASLVFTPALDLEWSGPRQLCRPECGMRLHKSVLASSARAQYRHVMALANNANIAYGLAHPPIIPVPPSEPAAAEGQLPIAATPVKIPDPQPKYLLGNGDEQSPHVLAFLGHLRALRVIFIPTWADMLWLQGIERGLIAVAPALGVCSWRISDSLDRWNACITSGVIDGWLPLETTRLSVDAVAA